MDYSTSPTKVEQSINGFAIDSEDDERASLIGSTYELETTKNDEKVSPDESVEDIPDDLDVPVSRTGSFFGALFNMINGPLGAGMLSFPFTFLCTGVIMGVILSTIVIVFSAVSLLTLTRLSFYHKKGVKNLNGLQSYQHCVLEHCGKFWKSVCELMLLIYGSCVLIVYYIILGQFIKPVIDVIFPGDNFYNNIKIIVIFFAIIFIYPLLLLREIKKLGCSSFLSVVASFYLVFFVIGWGIYSIASGNMGPGQEKLAFIQTAMYTGTYYPIIFIAIPMKLNGYMCHVLMFPVSYELKGGSFRKVASIIIVAVLVVSGIYVSLGLFGWFSFGLLVQDNLLNNFSGANVFGNVGRAALGLNLVLSLPIQHYSARLAIMTFFWGQKKKKFGTWTYLIITTCYFFLCVIISMFVPGLSIIFGFVGSTCCVAFMFFFPGLMAWKTLAKNEKGIWKVMWYTVAISFFAFFVFFGVTGNIASLLKLLAQYGVLHK